MARFGKFVEDVSGTEIVEAALVLPLVFLLMLAIFWFGRAFNISSTLTRAVKEGAITSTHLRNQPHSRNQSERPLPIQLQVGVEQLASSEPPRVCAKPGGELTWHIRTAAQGCQGMIEAHRLWSWR